MARSEIRQKAAVLADAINQNLENKDWLHLENNLDGSEGHPISARLRKKGWIALGDHYAEEENHLKAMKAFGFARVTDLNDGSILPKLFLALLGFYERFEKKFSREDLLVLREPVERIINFHEVHKPTEDANLRLAKDLQRRIRLQIELAPSIEETPATHHVQQIYSALYSDKMTIEEVRAEFARIMAPTFLEILREGETTGQQDTPKKKKEKRKPSKAKKKQRKRSKK